MTRFASRRPPVAELAGEALTLELSQPLADVSKAAGRMETHSPLFSGSAANPQGSLF